MKGRHPIVVDGVIFQMQRGRPHGISRLWRALLGEVGKTPLGGQILLLDREGSAPEIPGIRRRAVPPFSLRELEGQADLLDAVCREEGAALFLSTYYSFTRRTPALLMLYDMILELYFGAELFRSGQTEMGGLVRRLELEAKRAAIHLAREFMAISKATAGDLRRCYPESRDKPVAIVPCAASSDFRPPPAAAVEAFRRRYGIRRPYFLLVGSRGHYKNARLFMEAFAALPERGAFEVVMAGGEADLDAESRKLLGRTPWQIRFFPDDELRLAYAGATALVYPSRHEGFGLPVLEAMAVGCPVVACPVTSIPEVAGDAALYVDPSDPAAMARALGAVMRPEIRQELVRRGLERAGRFSWQASGAAFAAALAAALDRWPDPSRAATVASLATARPQTAAAAPEAPPAITDAPTVKVSAIVAAVNAGRFIRGCLEDLVGQTLFAQGGLEVIVVDGGSDEDEAAVVREFQARHPRIRFLAAEGREGVYRSWNRGIAAARGAYLTTANTDDRHRRDALERMAALLDERSEVALVYADLFQTEGENETFERCRPCGCYRWHDWDRTLLLSRGCFIGPQPMWRRTVHDFFGGFDETLVTSGDFEFWLRISQAFDFFHIREPLGLYLVRPDSIEHRHRDIKRTEDREIFARYRRAAERGELLGCLPLEELRWAARLGGEIPAERRRAIVEKIARLAGAAAGEASGARAAARRSFDALGRAIVAGDLSGATVEAFAAAAARLTLGRPRPVCGRAPTAKRPAPLPPEPAPGGLADALEPPPFFRVPGEVEAWCDTFAELTESIHAALRGGPPEPRWRELAFRYADRASLISLYFSRRSLKRVAVQRDAIARFVLRERGQELPAPAPRLRGASPRIRLAVYLRALGANTETRAALPVVLELDRERFETCVYTHAVRDAALAARVRQVAARLVILPDRVKESVFALRADRPDILLFGNNLTAGAHIGARLADYRMAPVQCVHFANPATTGRRHIDAFLLGRLIADDEELAHNYSERVIPVEGSGICFADLPAPPEAAPAGGREALGLPAAGTLFLSGANAFKLIPELRRIWAEILRQVPGSTLVLYPFGPAWAADYPASELVADLYQVFAQAGVAGERLRVYGTLPGPAEVAALNRAADVYLDAVPYSGATSLLDPLAVGLPPVVCAGRMLRFAQGAAMLRELGVPELVSADETAYIRLAVRLGRDGSMRSAVRRRLRERMASGPAFLDARAFSRRLARALESLAAPRPAAGGSPSAGAAAGNGISGAVCA